MVAVPGVCSPMPELRETGAGSPENSEYEQ